MTKKITKKVDKKPEDKKSDKKLDKKVDKKPEDKKPEKKTEVKKPEPQEDQEPKKKKIRTPQTVRGMRDILPEDEPYWRKCYETAQKIADDFGFMRIETPLVEPEELFVRAVGKVTDIVEKEMYTLLDRDEKKLALRPEATASLCRAFINNGMFNRPQPQKLWLWGPMFRYDRPQAGRYRQFYQADFEIIGDDSPATDAQIILLTYQFFKELGIETRVNINSIGLPDDRARYKMELVQWYRQRKKELCDNCQKRLVRNPLRLLDCKEEQCAEVREEAPQIIDWLSDDSKKHFTEVLEYLDELEIPYFVDTFLVRGLDYYTKTVFEFLAVDDDSELSQSSLCGGGRYDLLMEQLGGKETAACGVAPGIDRIVLAMKDRGVKPWSAPKPDLFVAQLGKQGKRRALALYNNLRDAGYVLDANFAKDALKTQLDIANEKEIPYVVLVGQKEVMDNTVIIRDMESGNQEVVDFDKIIPELKKKVKKTRKSTKKTKK